MPAFAIDGSLALLLARGATVAMLLLAFGTALFSVIVAPKALQRASAGIDLHVVSILQRLLIAALVASLIMMLMWLVLQAADLAGANGASALETVPTVLTGTTFGHVILAQLGALLVALLVRRQPWSTVIASGAALALQAGHGHAVAMEGFGPLLVSDVLHLLAAGAWLGGLPPLLVLIAAAPPRIGATGARWFTPLGKLAVLVLVASALVQFWVLIGSLPGLIGTAYGWIALVKLLLLAVLLAFAAMNRYRLAPALLRDDEAKGVLIRSVTIQAGVGLLTVFAAATLSQLPPSMHEQPLWPFALRPSLVTMAEPELRWEIAQAVLMVTIAVALLIVASLVRRARWPSLAAAAALGWIAAPHFQLLLVEAYPTSYYQSPTGFAADAISRGASLYGSACAGCHGADGKGDGEAADLTAPHLWDHDDGELFWWLTHGIPAPDGSLAMPGFAGRLSPDQRWALIDYVRAHNAGASLRDSGAWPRPLQAPELGIACTDLPAETTRSLRGSVLHVVAAAAAPPSAPGQAEPGVPIVTVLLSPAGMRPPAGTCAATDPAAWTAFAVIAGLPPEQLSGAQFLIDPDGWLRAVERPGENGFRWSDPSALLADARAICTTRVAETAPSGHIHH